VAYLVRVSGLDIRIVFRLRKLPTHAQLKPRELRVQLEIGEQHHNLRKHSIPSFLQMIRMRALVTSVAICPLYSRLDGLMHDRVEIRQQI
jgi:hypothetical protein